MNTAPVRYKQQAVLIILLALLLPMVVGGTNWIVDPLQIYRKQNIGQTLFWTNQRSQNAGKIRSYLQEDGYDSILVGNSVADNFRPSQISRRLGWKKTMKLTVDGGHCSEQAFMVEDALKHANIRHVLWVIRATNFFITQKERWHEKQSIPFYLYTEAVLDDGPYLLNLDILRFSINTLRGETDSRQWVKD